MAFRVSVMPRAIPDQRISPVVSALGPRKLDLARACRPDDRLPSECWVSALPHIASKFSLEPRAEVMDSPPAWQAGPGLAIRNADSLPEPQNAFRVSVSGAAPNVAEPA